MYVYMCHVIYFAYEQLLYSTGIRHIAGHKQDAWLEEIHI